MSMIDDPASGTVRDLAHSTTDEDRRLSRSSWQANYHSKPVRLRLAVDGPAFAKRFIDRGSKTAFDTFGSNPGNNKASIWHG